MTTIPVDRNQSLTLAAVIGFLRTAPLSTEGRVTCCAPSGTAAPTSSRLNTRLRAARRVPADFVESTINGITTSAVWQRDANATHDELRAHLAFEDKRPFAEELQTTLAIVDYSLRQHHWAAVENSRTAYHAGKTLGAEPRATPSNRT